MGLFAPPVAGFPFASHVGARAIYWAADQEEGADARLAVALFQAVFERGQSITDAAAVGRVADAVGLDGAALIDAVGMPAVKDRLRATNDRALAAGVCGAPFFIVDEEPYPVAIASTMSSAVSHRRVMSEMPIISSQINPRDADFKANQAHMAELVAELRAKVARIEEGGGERLETAISGAANCCRGPHRDADRPRHAVSRVFPIGRLGHVR